MSLKIGIVLLPDRATATLLTVLSEVASDLGNIMVLNGGAVGPRPHLSLFHMMARMHDFPRIAAAVDGLAVPGTIGGRGYKRHLVDDQWLFLQADGSGLSELQQQVVEAVGPLRTQAVEISWDMSPMQREAHRRCGYPNVGRAWDIHFTYGLLPKATDPRTVGPELEQIRAGMEMAQTWTAQAIAVVRIGDHGTAMEILHQRPLTPSETPG